MLFLLVASLSLVQTPVKIDQLTVSGAQHDASSWMATDSTDRDLEYPENYVFSDWGQNRMYNYFVNGQSRSYGFAQSNYESFATEIDGGEWYDRLGGRVGYVVTEGGQRFSDLGSGTLFARLHRNFGARDGSTPGLEHYRAVHASDDGSVKVFTLVPGATITGTGHPDEMIDVSTRVTIPGAQFSYTRQVPVGPSGNYSVTVPYPGTYEAGNETVVVSYTAVMNGTRVDATG